MNVSYFFPRQEQNFPGFMFQDQFCDYMFAQAIKQDWRILTDNKAKFLLVHSSSGFKHSLKGAVSYQTGLTEKYADTEEALILYIINVEAEIRVICRKEVELCVIKTKIFVYH